MAVILLELFSGIGGFAEGFKQAGITIDKHYFSEVDKYAIANYQYNYDKAEYIGSVKHVRHIIRTINKHRKPTDQLIITSGSPCQDFSLAGKRAGLAGAKSSLLHFALVLIKWLKPDLYIWENVKGAFSSNNGADFWAIIKAFTNIGGYTIEWQLLNTAWFLPQNRERIYLAGHFGGRSKPGLFPIGENDSLFAQQIQPNQRRTQTQYCGTLTDKMRAYDTFIQLPKKVGTISGGVNSGGAHSQMALIEVSIGAQRSRNYRNQPEQLEVRADGLSNSITSVNKDNYVVIQANTKKGYDIATNGDSIDLKSTTRKGIVCKAKAHAIDTQANQAVVVSHDGRLNKETKYSEIVPTLKAQSHGHEPMAMQGTSIRRLTEIECERLQGFADNWTKYGVFTKKVYVTPYTWFRVNILKEISPTQRYKMLGNAVTVAVVKAVASKIKFIEQ